MRIYKFRENTKNIEIKFKNDAMRISKIKIFYEYIDCFKLQIYNFRKNTINSVGT